MTKSYLGGERNNNLAHKPCFKNPSICLRIVFKGVNLSPMLVIEKRKREYKVGAEPWKSPEPKNMEGIGSPSYSHEIMGSTES